MKTLVVMLGFLAGSAAMAQIGGGVLSSEPTVIGFNSHNAHASQQGMGELQAVMERGAPLIAQGERPVWEVAPPKPTAVPLGDIARMLKKERLAAKKAATVWEN
jgi:hypothetical protein